MILNLVGADGLTWEGRSLVSVGGAGPLEATRPPTNVRRWIERFEAQERATLSALIDEFG